MGGVTLALFDIDGTLLRSGGSGRMAMQQAANELFYQPDMFGDLSFAGAVDSQIVRLALENAGIPATDRRVGRLHHRYVRRLVRNLRNPVGERCPGVERAVREVALRAEVGLLTGNWKEGARAKLAGFGLDGLFEGCVGAYGGDGMCRDDLVPVAVRRAQRRLGRVRRVVVIGDTAADVECARAGDRVLPNTDVFAVAVATGFAPYDDLVAAQPDVLIPDLERGLSELVDLL